MNRVWRKRPELLDDSDDAESVVQTGGTPSPEEAAEARAFDEAVAHGCTNIRSAVLDGPLMHLRCRRVIALLA